MSNGLITLTTDFGLADHFVASMKGVILSIAPRTRIVDVSHQITPYDPYEAGFVIAQTWHWFPKGTIHLVVVDPGVGNARRSILVEAERHFFVGPDNGVFSMVFDSVKHRVRNITNPRYMLSRVSKTFHGRDVFAPVAAHLAIKTPVDRFGEVINDPVFTANFRPELVGTKLWRGTILKVDRFGNLITNLHTVHVGELRTDGFELRIGPHKIRRFASTYAEAEIGELFIIVGSSGYLEIAANQDNASQKLGCRSGTPVELEIY